MNLSKVLSQGSIETVASPNNFTSPEELRNEAITPCTDFWALGVLVFNLCKGKFIKYSSFKEGQFNAEGTSKGLNDFVNKLLLLNPEERLGTKGISQLKNHSFFKDFDWASFE